MKMNKRVSNEAGFTLVEIIVTLVILTLVLTVAGSVYFYGVRMYTQTEVKNTEKYVGDNVYKYMQQKITYATKLEVRPDRSDDKTYQKYITNMKDNTRVSDAASGYLYFGDYTNNTEENVLGDSFYGNYTIKYQITLPVATKDTDKDIAVENLLDLTVLVLDQDGQEVYKTEGRIKNLNGTLTVNGDRKALYTNPLIVYNDTAEQEIDPAMAIANQLRTDYTNLYEYIYDHPNADTINVQYPGWTDSEVGGKWYPDNSSICRYLFKYKYKNTWPTFPAQSSTKDQFAYVNNYFKNYPTSSNQLYMRPYCATNKRDNTRGFAEKNCYVFVSGNQAEGWTGYFIMDTWKSEKYVTTPHTSNHSLTGKSILTDVWNTEVLLQTGNWQLFEK